MYECRCDERLKTKTEGSTRLAYTGLLGGLQHLKIEMRLIEQKFASVMLDLTFMSVVYYKSRNRDLEIRLMHEGRYDERLKTRVEESTSLTYTGLHDKTN